MYVSNLIRVSRRDLRTLSPPLGSFAKLLKVVVRFRQGNLFQIMILQVQILKFFGNISQFPSQSRVVDSFG